MACVERGPRVQYVSAWNKVKCALMTSTPPHQGSKRRRIDDLDLRAVETGWTEFHFHPSRETLFGSFETAIGFLKEKDPVMFHVSIPVDGEALRKVPRLEDTHRKLGVNAEAKKYLLAGYHLGFHVMKTLFEITQPGEEWDKGKAQLNASIDKAEFAITNPLNVLALEGILIAFHAFEAVEMQRRQERAGGEDRAVLVEGPAACWRLVPRVDDNDNVSTPVGNGNGWPLRA